MIEHSEIYLHVSKQDDKNRLPSLEVVEELSSEWKVSEQEDSLDDDSSSLKYPASLISSVWSVWT